MYFLSSLVALLLINFVTTAHPLFDRSIISDPRELRNSSNALLHHGGDLSHIVHQSVNTPHTCSSQSHCTQEQECILLPTTGCKSGICIGCTTTADCMSGFVCLKQQFGNFCVHEDVVCSSSTDCKEQQLCSKQKSDTLGFCVDKGPFCESDDDCTKPETCTIPLPGGLGTCAHKCNNDSDCGERQLCLASTCITSECTSDSDCGGEENCIFGSCVSTDMTVTTAPVTTPPVATPCSSDNDCQLGFVCDSANAEGDRFCVVLVCESLKKPTSGASLTQDMQNATETKPTTALATTTTVAATSADSTDTKPLPNVTSSAEQSAQSTPSFSTEPSSESAPESSRQPSTDSDPEPSPLGDAGSPSAVCIDARALSDLTTDELVFDKHVLSWVLCDVQESCATAGHMVVFEGRAMMMNTYCAMVGCERKSMYVNSARYRRGLKVQSRTEGLHYTVFAARHESAMEEMVLRAAIRVGL